MPVHIKKSDIAFAAQLFTFMKKINDYKDIFDLSPTDIQNVTVDAVSFNWMVTSQDSVQTFKQNYMAFKSHLRNGDGDRLGPLPRIPRFTRITAMPATPGVEPRFRAFINRMKHHPAYTRAIGEDLGIEGPEGKSSTADARPDFRIELLGGHPNLRWTKGKFEGVTIWKDAGNGFKKLDTDMNPDYLDESPLPPKGTSATWRYKMKYLMNDHPVGEWSDVESVTVNGGD